MSKEFVRTGLVALAALCLGFGSSVAQDRLPAGDEVHERLVEFSGMTGWLNMDDKLDYEGGAPLVGLRATLNHSAWWSFEGELSFVSSVSREIRRGEVTSYIPHLIYGLTLDTQGNPIPIGFVISEMETREFVEESSSNLLVLGGSMLFHTSRGRWRPFVKLGGGLIDDISNMSEDPPAPLSDPFLEFGLGLKYLRPSGFGVRVEVADFVARKNDVPRENPRAGHVAAQLDFASGGTGQSIVPYSPVDYNGQRWLNNIGVQVSVSMPFGFAWKDGDGDGIETRFDSCPSTAPGVVVDGLGCGIDTDKDGVFDGLDTCSDTPLGAIVDLTGCPSDIDLDGVFDGIDVADNTPPGALVDEVGQHYDTDKDGIFDGLDLCNDTPLGASIDENGCVQDPIEDRFLRGQAIVVTDVRFESGTDEIDPLSYHYVNKIARLVERWTGNDERPLQVELGIHTDGVGSEARNLALSQRRAEKIRVYLMQNFFGIGANNLVAIGYGETQPLASDDDVDGREKNSRLEVRFTGEGEAPEEYDFGAEFDVGPIDDLDAAAPTAPVEDEADAAAPVLDDEELSVPEDLEIPDEEPDFPDFSDDPEN